MLLDCFLFFIDNSSKMKRHENILSFLCKIPRTERSVEEATEIATDDIHPSFMNNTYAFTVNTVSPGYQTDAASSLTDCWNTMQNENFQKKQDGLIVLNKKLGCDHSAKCDCMSKKEF